MNVLDEVDGWIMLDEKKIGRQESGDRYFRGDLGDLYIGWFSGSVPLRPRVISSFSIAEVKYFYITLPETNSSPLKLKRVLPRGM